LTRAATTPPARPWGCPRAARAVAAPAASWALRGARLAEAASTNFYRAFRGIWNFAEASGPLHGAIRGRPIFWLAPGADRARRRPRDGLGERVRRTSARMPMLNCRETRRRCRERWNGCAHQLACKLLRWDFAGGLRALCAPRRSIATRVSPVAPSRFDVGLGPQVLAASGTSRDWTRPFARRWASGPPAPVGSLGSKSSEGSSRNSRQGPGRGS